MMALLALPDPLEKMDATVWMERTEKTVLQVLQDHKDLQDPLVLKVCLFWESLTFVGPAGKDGVDGKTGEVGPAGPQGKNHFINDYKESRLTY
jgi:hypothetical protein